MFTFLPAAALLLSTFVNQSSPWLQIAANSEQRQPVYLGTSPLQIMQGHPGAAHLVLSTDLQNLASFQANTIRIALGRQKIQLETWPVRDDNGQITWAFARWREDSKAPWKWLDSAEIQIPENITGDRALFIPATYRPWLNPDHALLFDDFLTSNELYTKPLFGDCIWTNEKGTGVMTAWLHPDHLASFKNALERTPTRQGEKTVCRLIPQPARFNGKPISIVIEAQEKQIYWPSNILWKKSHRYAAPDFFIPSTPLITSWPKDFEAAYEADLKTLDGEQIAIFPVSGQRAQFLRKNSADPQNQLTLMVQYLKERYSRLGIRTVEQTWNWRNIPQKNLVAIIPGSLPPAQNRPVLLADHIDTAFCEDEFNRTGQRVAAIGADDNITATAALLRAAEVLRSSSPLHDIWLVHLTGEEFPADDLGARAMVSSFLKEGRNISGLILMDMIGYRNPKDRIFQINAGDSNESLALAELTLSSAKATAPQLQPVIRSRFDERSYLYNTDGLIFSDAGYPIVLLNEHINRLENFDRPHYHQTTDLSGTIDWHYASTIVKVAIEAAARLSRIP